MTLSDVVMILAVLLAPFGAVFAQKKVELWRETRSRKLWVFKTLMATRGRPLSPEHVQALNMIDLEFIDKNEKLVIVAWKEYHDHLGTFPKDGDNLHERTSLWHQRREDLFAAMLVKMSETLDYTFDVVQIKRGIYAPEGHMVSEFENELLRKMVLEWLTGNRRVLVSVAPLNEENSSRSSRLHEDISRVLRGEQELKVKMDIGTPPSS